MYVLVTMRCAHCLFIYVHTHSTGSSGNTAIEEQACRIMHEPLAHLRSHMTVDGQDGADEACLAMLQWMLLDGIANGSLRTQEQLLASVHAMFLHDDAQRGAAQRVLVQAWQQLQYVVWIATNIASHTRQRRNCVQGT